MGCQKGQKMAQNDKKTMLCLISQEPIYHMTFIHGTHVEKYNISMFFSHFSEILLFGVSTGVKGQKMAQNDNKLSVTLHVSKSIHSMILLFVSFEK